MAISAVVFRVLLGLEADAHWKRRVEDGLLALTACSFRILGGDLAGTKQYGTFLAQWSYQPAGRGDHGQGVYHLWITPGFLGALRLFEVGTRTLPAGEAVTAFDLTRRPTQVQAAELGWGVDPKTRRRRKAQVTLSYFDAGAPLYHAAEKLPPAAAAWVYFVESQLTRRCDALAKGHDAPRAGASAADAHKPRL